jgi:hypothetical protein
VLGGDETRAIVLLDGEVEVASLPVGHLARPDLDFVDALARFQLAARRLGYDIGLRGPCGDLLALIALVGLDEVLRLAPTAPAGADAVASDPCPTCGGTPGAGSSSP